MGIKIKNWSQLQHFKDRKPIWIKLYRSLLDDPDWSSLNGEDAKILVMLWLLSSEHDGELPSIKNIAFRLRTTEKSILSTISRLEHWLINDDINVMQERYQVDALEKRREETEKRREDSCANEKKMHEVVVGDEFIKFWQAYPKKVGRKAAEKAFQNAQDRPRIDDLLAAIQTHRVSPQWLKDDGQYIPNPSTWLNRGQWADVVTKPRPSVFEEFLTRGGEDDESTRISTRLAATHEPTLRAVLS